MSEVITEVTVKSEKKDGSLPQLVMELTTTSLCDMKCTYCFEGEKVEKARFSDYDMLVEKIKEIRASDFYKKFSGISLNFWGGEPTLNWKYIKAITAEYRHDPDVVFHLYSNGYNFKNLQRTLSAFVDEDYEVPFNIQDRVFIQISYDGLTNDIFRISSKGDTSQNVMRSFQHLVDEGYNVHFKSTLPVASFKDMFANWCHFRDLFYKYKDNKNARISFAPTIDYTQKACDIVDYQGTVELFKEQIMKIAKEEIKFYKENKEFLLSWFNTPITPSKTNCSAGVNFVSIDGEGDSYACHGAFYAPNKEELKSTSLYSENFIEELSAFNKRFEDVLDYVPEGCQGCSATYCAVCPVALTENSKKVGLIDRWTDRTAHGLCGFYKPFGMIHRAMFKHLNTLDL